MVVEVVLVGAVQVVAMDPEGTGHHHAHGAAVLGDGRAAVVSVRLPKTEKPHLTLFMVSPVPEGIQTYGNAGSL